MHVFNEGWVSVWTTPTMCREWERSILAYFIFNCVSTFYVTSFYTPKRVNIITITFLLQGNKEIGQLQPHPLLHPWL